jgi:dienelactone hydrolase
MVEIPVKNGAIRAELALPLGPVRGAAVVALHGRGGPYPERDGQWRDLLTAAGHAVLLPDSFGSRGLGSQCRHISYGIGPAGVRRQDAIASARWLAAQPFAPPGGVVIMGWSNGASTVLATARADRDDLPPRLVRGFVAFYPGCRVYAAQEGWAPAEPMLIMVGKADDWTPAEPCRRLATGQPKIELVTYPGAYHEFDAPNLPIQVRQDLAFIGGWTGSAHVGTNPGARADALGRVPAYIDSLSATQ